MKREAKIIFIGALVVILFGFLSSELLKNRTASYNTLEEVRVEEGSFACTTDAKVCNDGTFVGRVPPYCQFAPCPSESLSSPTL